ncbi:MAG: hypothetical protein ABMA02_18440 [Saprospiraceae bacterium]
MLELLPLEAMLQFFRDKFRQQEVFHIVKSLTYFDDAENYADPLVFDQSITWSSVKGKILLAIRDSGE